MSKVFWALDLGTTTGYAVGGLGADISGTWNLKPSRFDSGGMRFVKFRQQLSELLMAGKPEVIGFEEVRRHQGVDAAHVYGGLLAVLQAFCIDNGIEYTGYSVGTIKAFATGKGNASKAQMIEAVQAWGYDVADDNQADAIALLKLMASQR
jgi:Holliday junction resolvasome RuvABC endonuclease subunit